MPEVIDTFATGGSPHRFLSNFEFCWMSATDSESSEDREWSTVEHHYQAAKTNDPIWQHRILRAKSPGEAKRLGKTCPLRPDFDSIKVDVMAELLSHKFGPMNPNLCTALMDTLNAEIIEKNWWHDTFWGVCNGKGQNWLGKLLMERRKQLFKEALR